MSTFLKRVLLLDDKPLPAGYPFNVPAFSKGIDVKFDTCVTFIVGENGAGKSTLLEAIAAKCGFTLAGGSPDHFFESDDARSDLEEYLRASWFPRVTGGFFLRAETFFNFGSYISRIPDADHASLKLDANKDSIHHQSHGEFFLALFLQRRFQQRGIFILDEPEAALSPNSQLAFLAALNTLEKAGQGQFIIATHSPILLCYPGAKILQVTPGGIAEIDYRETEHYKITKEFLNCPERFFKHLFAE